MPIYMDRHDVSDAVTAEKVAQLHQEDLKIQDKFGCRGITYWFDDKRKTAFCLIEAPNARTVENMHKYAHGDVPHHIIEVDARIVESFLGRIEDPQKSNPDEMNIINDSAFRILIVISMKRKSVKKQDAECYYNTLEKYKNSLKPLIIKHEGRIVTNTTSGMLLSFRSATQAVSIASAISNSAMTFADRIIHNIGISAGLPVTDNTALFAATIKSAEQICNTTKAPLTITSAVKTLYKSENNNTFFVDDELTLVLNPMEEQFISDLNDYIGKVWAEANVRVEEFAKNAGYSKSQFYRIMLSLTGKSPIAYLKDYRMDRALELLESQNHQVSEVAYITGFNSASYFSKCFNKRYDVIPSELLE